MPSSSARSNQQSTTNDANASTNGNQYGVEQLTKDSSDCKKLKSGKVCMTSNRPFLKKRSLTFASLFSPKSSRSASTNSLQQCSLVDQTIASVLQPINFSEFLNESNKTVSESNLNSQQSAKRFFSARNPSRLCKANSTTSTLTDENAHLDNLVSSFGSDLDINSQSTNELNRSDDSSNPQQTPNFPPPSYTPLDPTKRLRRPLLLRSQSAPQPFHFGRSTSAGAGELFSNTHILENIQEISDQHSLLPEVVEEEDEEGSMASRRNSYLNHQFNCRLAHEKEILPIPRFNTVKELYERISMAFNIDVDQVSASSCEIDTLVYRTLVIIGLSLIVIHYCDSDVHFGCTFLMLSLSDLRTDSLLHPEHQQNRHGQPVRSTDQPEGHHLCARERPGEGDRDREDRSSARFDHL